MLNRSTELCRVIIFWMFVTSGDKCLAPHRTLKTASQILPVLILRSLILLSMLVVHHKAAVYTGHRQHTALFHMGHSQMIELQCSFGWSQQRKSQLVGSQNKSKQGKSLVRFRGVRVHRNFQLVTFQIHKCHCYGWMKVEAIAVFLFFIFRFLLWEKSFPLGKRILRLCDSYIFNL